MELDSYQVLVALVVIGNVEDESVKQIKLVKKHLPNMQ